jgi:hypothetical protein
MATLTRRWSEPKVEVEARRVIRTGREEVRVPELCFSRGDQENPPKLSHSIRGRCLYAESK